MKLPDISLVSQIYYGEDPYLDAWLLHFMDENHLEYWLKPGQNASPEQLRFMVSLEEDQFFFPCSNELFRLLLSEGLSRNLQTAYNTSWRVVAKMAIEHVKDEYLRRKILQFCRHRFRIALSSHILIPSRMTKRLVSIFLTQSGLLDPFRERKILYNRRVKELMDSPMLDGLVNACPLKVMSCDNLQDLRWELDMLELRRLFILSSLVDIWHKGDGIPDLKILKADLARPCREFERIREVFGSGAGSNPKKILYLCNSSGGVLFDLMIIRSFLRQGHSVILVFKEAFYFQTPTIWDMEYDPVLARALKGAYILTDNRVSKNQLLKLLREHRFVVISDGTRERLNLYRVSVTFSRAWKECDIIVAKGDPHQRRLIKTSHKFTRDILCFYRDLGGDFHLAYKPRAEGAGKFADSDLRRMADEIIKSMNEAKLSGKSVMFYSAVIGSIPGQTKTAVKVLNTFVKRLRAKYPGAFIINPAEHFEHGLDGDDLMYMWERVQRSGLLDIWRFQTYSDIEESFELMGMKVPTSWTGKDATYSTGCTQEMRIALDMQSRHPEMQIIGPSPEKFFRRREYGVGKYFDAGINIE